MKLKLLDSYDPLLREECEPFNFEKGYNGMNATEIFELLKENMIAHRGVGLSACQIGINTRVFVIGDPGNEASIIPVFNPKIVHYSDEEVVMEEGCLSFPGLFVRVKRPTHIRARFANLLGEVDVANFTGFTARVFQHEYDHMDGMVFTRRAQRHEVERGYRQQKKLNRERKRNVKRAYADYQRESV